MYKDFVHCFHPMKIRNSSGEWITVSCGTCQACLSRMSNKASYQCSLHEQDFKYCMFVTLTYSNENIPLARLEDYEDFGTIEEDCFYDRLEDGKYDEGFKGRQVKEEKSR